MELSLGALGLEGLDGSIGALLDGVSEEEAQTLDPEALSKRLCQQFGDAILPLSEQNLPALSPSSSLVDLLQAWARSPALCLPVCDESNRVVGHVRVHDLLESVGKVLHLEPEPEPDVKLGPAPNDTLLSVNDVGIPLL